MNPNTPAHMMTPEPPDDACVDADGEEYPEHDFPPVGHGDECRRCGAEADPEPDEDLDARLRDGVKQLLSATQGHEFPPDYAQRLVAKATETVVEADRIITEAQERG